MSIIHFVAVLLMIATVGAVPATKPTTRPREGSDAPDTANVKSKDGFGAQLWFVDAKLIDDWIKPQLPKIAPIKTAKRDVRYLAALIFAGAGADQDGKARVTYDFEIRAPDGSVFGKGKELVAWDLAVPAPRELQLAHESVIVKIEKTDPAGKYTIDFVVHDRVGNVDLALTATFTAE